MNCMLKDVKTSVRLFSEMRKARKEGGRLNVGKN